MSSDDWFETAYEDWEKEREIYAKWERVDKKFGWKFTSDWSDLNPCLDIDIILFDVSLFCIYILPQNRLVGFQLFGVGIEWSW